MKQRELVQEKIEARLAVLDDPQDPDETLKEVKERQADGIADVVAESKDNLLESIKGMVEAELD